MFPAQNRYAPLQKKLTDTEEVLGRVKWGTEGRAH